MTHVFDGAPQLGPLLKTLTVEMLGESILLAKKPGGPRPMISADSVRYNRSVEMDDTDLVGMRQLRLGAV
jgi:hypothetical protein